VVSHNKKNCGRRLKDYSTQTANIHNIPLSDRSCFRSTSVATGIPMTRLHSIIKSGGIRRHSSAVKPLLTEENKQTRVVHVDEKWFYMKHVKITFFLAKGEKDPYRACKSKRNHFFTNKLSIYFHCYGDWLHLHGANWSVPAITLRWSHCCEGPNANFAI
jgi:hypothetical protein